MEIVIDIVYFSVVQVCNIRQIITVIVAPSSIILYYMCRANWVQVNGTKYKTPFALVVGKKDDLVFGKVENVCVDVSLRHRYLIKQQDLIDYHP